MFVDYIMNQNGSWTGGGNVGGVIARMGGMRFDPGLLRPYLDDAGVQCCTVNTGTVRWDDKLKRYVPKYENVRTRDLQASGIHSPVFNLTSLRKEEWLMMDPVAVEAYHLRTKAWADLAGASKLSGFDGMSKMILEHETSSDGGSASMDMDGLVDLRDDTQHHQLEGLPLPITQSGFWLSERRLAVSRNSGSPIDINRAAQAGRRVGELVEKVTIGVETGPTYGGNSTHVGGYGRTSKVYGYLNFTDRLTYTSVTTPTGTNPQDTVDDFLACRDLLLANKSYGPWMVYHSNDWDRYLDNDYAFTNGTGYGVAPTKTLRNRLREIDGIMDVRRLDFLASSATTFANTAEAITTANPFTFIFVEFGPQKARAVEGLPGTLVQWPEQGGARLCFRFLTISVPQLFADFDGNCGILVATTS